MKIWLGWFCKLAVLCAIAGSAYADSPYPVRPVTIVVAAPPGGQTDVVTRVVAQQLSIQLGQPVVIENKSGATGNIGTTYVARATPDGYTLVVVPTAYTANPSVIRDMPFDAVKDFKMIVHMTSNPNVLVVNVDSPYHTLQDIIRAAKASPGALTSGDVGPGSTMSLFMEKLKALTKIDILSVPYRGSAPADVDLMGGRISMVFDSLPGATPLIEGQKLRAIAVSSAQRSAGLPNVPTVAESGVQGFEAESWLGLAAPAGTPDEVVEKLNRATNEALNTPKIRAQLIKMGTRPIGGTSAEFDSLVKRELATWKKVLSNAGIQPH